MNTKIAAALVALSAVALAVIVSTVSVVSTLNREATLSTAIKAKQKDNANEMDGMWKTISQAAQVTDAHKSALIEIFNGYAAARTGTKGGGSLATWITESVPNVDAATFSNLQNIITSKRDGFVMRQKELLDLSREHERLLKTIPSGWICSMFGRGPIDVVVVTSTRTDSAFKSGKDDDVSVFNK